MTRLSRVLLGVIALGLLGAGWAVHRLGGWRYTAHRLHTLDAWPTYTQRASQLELLPPAERGVLLLGDSHVANGEWAELLPAHRTYNRGVPAEGSRRLRRSKYLRRAYTRATDTVVLQVGTNDLLFESQLPRDYWDLVWWLKSDTTDCFLLCTLPGVNNEVRWTGIDPADVAQANTAIRELAASYWTVRLVDVAAALGTVDGVLPAHLTDDGVHLRGEGYALWADAIEQALEPRSALPQKD